MEEKILWISAGILILLIIIITQLKLILSEIREKNESDDFFQGYMLEVLIQIKGKENLPVEISEKILAELSELKLIQKIYTNRTK